MALACPNKNSKEWKNLVSLYGENGAYKAFIANNYQIPAMNQDTHFDDFVDGELNPRNFSAMPFKFSAKAIASGKKTITVRSNNFLNGTYSSGEHIFNIINKGIQNVSQYLKDNNLTIAEFKNKFISGEEVRLPHIKDFLEGKTSMFIYEVAPVHTVDDIITPMDDVRFQKTLLQKKRTLRILEQQLKQKLTPERRLTLRGRADTLKEQIKRLSDVDKRTFDTVVLNAAEDLELIKNLLASGITTSDIEYAKSLIYGYINTLSQFDVESVEDKQNLTDLIDEITRLDKQLDESYITLANKINQKIVGKPITINGVLMDSNDIKVDTLYGFDTTKNQNFIVQGITKLIKKALQTRDQAILIFETEHHKIMKSLKDYQASKGLKGDDVYDFMVQKFMSGKKKGQKSGLYVSEYTADYYEALKEADNRIEFLAKEHTFSVDDIAWQEKQANIREFYANKEVQLSEKQLAARMTLDELKTQLADRYIASINPYTMKTIFEKIGRSGLTGLNAQELSYFNTFEKRYGWKNNGKQILNKTPLSKWNDPKYSEIKKMSQTDPRRVFFEHFDKHIKTGRKELAEDESYLPWNYIPERKKDLGIVKNVKQWWTDQVSQKIAQNIHGIDPITEEPLKQIPVFTLSGRVRPEDKSYDLDNVLKNFMYETKNKKYMSEIEDDVKVLQQVLQKQKVYKTNPDGTPQTINGQIQYKKASSNNYEQASYRIAAQIYGERQDKEGISNIKKYDEVDKDRMKEIKQRISEFGFSDEKKKELNTYIGSPKSLTDKDEIEYVKLAQELREIESRHKNVTVSKTVNFARLFTSIKLLGLNLFGGITEIMQGIGSLMIEGAAGQFFTTEEGLVGLKTMIASLGMGDQSQEKKKLRNLSKLFKVEGEIQYGEEKNIVTNVAYYQYRIAKLFVNNGFLVAMLKHEKIKDKSGLEHSLYDVMQVADNGLITLPDNFENPFTNVDDQGNINTTEASVTLQQKFREIIKANRDRDSSEDPILVDKTSIGRILGQFKASWMFEAFNKRFGRERSEDIYTGKSSKGFYRSVKDAFITQHSYTDDLGETQYTTRFDALSGIKALWQFSFFQKYGKEGYQGEMSELDQANMKRFMREMSLIAIMIGVIAVLRSLDGGDDDDYVKMKSLNYLINQSVRIQRDLTTYMSPNSFASILRNPAPITSTLIDMAQIGSATIQTVFGHPYAYEGTSREYLKLPRRLEEATPFARQIRGLYNKFDKQIDYSRE